MNLSMRYIGSKPSSNLQALFEKWGIPPNVSRRDTDFQINHIQLLLEFDNTIDELG